MTPLRAAGVLAALLVCAVLAVALRQAAAEERAERLVLRTPEDTPGRTTEAQAALRRAEWLNPDERVELVRAQLVSQLGRPEETVRILQRITRREPENIEAWAALAYATTVVDPAQSARAEAQVRRLAPPVR